MKNIKTETSAFGTRGRISHDSKKFYATKLYSELNAPKKIEKMVNKYPEVLENKLVLGSSEDMSMIPDCSLHLMITSPPYNVGKEYDEDLSLKEYFKMLKGVFQETYRVLVNGGRACINIANLGRKPYIPLSAYISHMMIDIGFQMRGEIIWNKGASASPSTAWGSWMSASNPTLRDVHEYILVFSKGDYRRVSPKKGDVLKRNTIKKEEFMAWTKSVWTFGTESAKRVRHPAPYPIELPYRLIQLYSFTNDVVLDPFMGSGTTAIAALQSKRKYIGFDIIEEYITLAEKRLEPYQNSIGKHEN